MSWDNLFQSWLSHPISLMSIWILFCCVHRGLPRSLFHSLFPTEPLHEILFITRATCHTFLVRSIICEDSHAVSSIPFYFLRLRLKYFSEHPLNKAVIGLWDTIGTPARFSEARRPLFRILLESIVHPWSHYPANRWMCLTFESLPCCDCGNYLMVVVVSLNDKRWTYPHVRFPVTTIVF